ncbi:hypothetical protein AALP_AA7G159900 [Arabis alpina]|uniref:Peptidyl-prolyl cis-trans isomerase n=1 Tax=Arabis alpina TaxID=50452 RepID=A0A087GID9_ARAAL|nr:hypothetical protein AALP_AA7G159900 [Arabis alpina]
MDESPKMVYPNPKVFFDMEVDGMRAGRIVMELFADTTPMTTENFRALCTGEKGMGMYGKPLHFKGSLIHDIVPDLYWRGGDITDGGGWGRRESIYGPKFPDENFIKSHDRPGILSMTNCDPDANGSQFQILMREYPLLDQSHVVFGQVVEGFDVIKVIDSMVGTPNGDPSRPLKIADCGQIGGAESLFDKYEGLDDSEIPMEVRFAIALGKLAELLRAAHLKLAELMALTEKWENEKVMCPA